MESFAQLLVDLSHATKIANTSVSGDVKVNNGTFCLLLLSRALKVSRPPSPSYTHVEVSQDPIALHIVKALMRTYGSIHIQMPNVNIKQHSLAVYVQHGGM